MTKMPTSIERLESIYGYTKQKYKYLDTRSSGMPIIYHLPATQLTLIQYPRKPDRHAASSHPLFCASQPHTSNSFPGS